MKPIYRNFIVDLFLLVLVSVSLLLGVLWAIAEPLKHGGY